MTAVDRPVLESELHHHHMLKMQQPETAKSVHVYLNGDKHYPGRKFVINRRHISDFNGFLNEVTMGIKAPFGAVRNIYTPQSGHRVNELSQLQTGMQVVAGGVERFRKLEYREIGSKKRQPQPRRNYQDIKIHHHRMMVSARWRKYIKDPCQIFVYGNGDVIAPAVKLLLIPRIMKTWDLVLGEITEKICVRTGQAVRKLYDMQFHLLNDPSELKNGSYYIAVGTEKLKKYPYGDLHNKSPSPRKAPHAPLPPIKRTMKPRPPYRDDSDNTYSKMYAQRKQHKARIEETTVMGASAATGYRPLKTRKFKSQASESYVYEEDSSFSKTVKVKQQSATLTTHETHPVIEDVSDGVYKTETELYEAATIDEDENTKVDLPIDQVAAKEIDEEEDIPEVASHRIDDVTSADEEPTTGRSGDERDAIDDLSPRSDDDLEESIGKGPEQTTAEVDDNKDDDKQSVREEKESTPEPIEIEDQTIGAVEGAVEAAAVLAEGEMAEVEEEPQEDANAEAAEAAEAEPETSESPPLDNKEATPVPQEEGVKTDEQDNAAAEPESKSLVEEDTGKRSPEPKPDEEENDVEIEEKQKEEFAQDPVEANEGDSGTAPLEPEASEVNESTENNVEENAQVKEETEAADLNEAQDPISETNADVQESSNAIEDPKEEDSNVMEDPKVEDSNALEDSIVRNPSVTPSSPRPNDEEEQPDGTTDVAANEEDHGNEDNDKTVEEDSTVQDRNEKESNKNDEKNDEERNVDKEANETNADQSNKSSPTPLNDQPEVSNLEEVSDQPRDEVKARPDSNPQSINDDNLTSPPSRKSLPNGAPAGLNEATS